MITKATLLATPSHDESIRVWTGTHPFWGAALSLSRYLTREQTQATIPLARNGGLAPWILTTTSSSPRPILSSCETLKKRALVRHPNGSITEGTAHGVASVFTEPQVRKNGYAGSMMGSLASMLADLERQNPGQALFSVLWSDIGKTFYAKSGWKPFESSHLEFPSLSPSTTTTPSPSITLIPSERIPELAARDEHLLRKAIINAPLNGKTLAAIMPDNDQYQWHLAREAFACADLLPLRAITAHGAEYVSPSGGLRVWAIWKRDYSGSLAQPEKNSLSILRLVIDNENEEDVNEEELECALSSILQAARREAGMWECGKVVLWNPSERVRRLIEADGKLESSFVVREEDSICSLRWFGKGSVDDVEWIGNEKYCWC